MEYWSNKINRWRLLPRAMVAMYGYIFYDVIQWFMILPEPNGPQAAFVSTVVGAAAGFFGFYVNSGDKSNET